MCPGWPRHSAWVSGQGEPASPRLEACAPAGRAGFELGWLGQPRGQGRPAPRLTFSGHPAEVGSCCRLGRGQVQGAKALPRHSDGQWGLARLEGHAQRRGSVACKSRGQSGASTRQQQASRQDQGLWPRRCTTPGSGLRAPRVYLLSPAARSTSCLPGQAVTAPSLLPGPRGKVVAARAPRVSPGSDPNSPRGRGAGLRARARRRRPRPTPPAGPDRL